MCAQVMETTGKENEREKRDLETSSMRWREKGGSVRQGEAGRGVVIRSSTVPAPSQGRTKPQHISAQQLEPQEHMVQWGVRRCEIRLRHATESPLAIETRSPC